jgi:hypothetical protein
MLEECFYELTSQYNWASSAVGTVRPDRLISARLRRKFSTAFSNCLLPVVLPNITEYTVKQ